MHLFGFVAVNTNHVALDDMNVTLAPFSQVFITNPAAVTGSTLIEQVRAGLKQVSIDKSFADRSRSADMTATAAGVALTAVAFEAHVDGFVSVLPGTLLKDGGEGT